VQVDVNTRQLQERDNQVTGSGGDALPSEVSPDPSSFKPDPSPVLEQLSIVPVYLITTPAH